MTGGPRIPPVSAARSAGSVERMELTRTRELLPTVIWRESSPSTNAELRELVAGRGHARAMRDPGALRRTAGDGGVGSAGAGDGSAVSGGRSEALPHEPREPQELPHGTLLATANQTAGRGRLDRGWVTPPDTAVAASLLVRGFGRSGLGVGWLPLLTGSAIATALQPYFGDRMRVGVKWPNDVHVRDEDDAIAGRPGLKLCGILCEMIDPETVIVGTGINLLIPEEDLPTGRAASLLSAGADVPGGVAAEPEARDRDADPQARDGDADLEAVDRDPEPGARDRDADPGAVRAATGPDPEHWPHPPAPTLADTAGQDLADRVLAAYAAELLRLIELAAVHPGAARARVARHSLTLGTEVRVHLPGGEVVDGRARELADDGSLVVDLPMGGTLTVSAGDVEHLR